MCIYRPKFGLHVAHWPVVNAIPIKTEWRRYRRCPADSRRAHNNGDISVVASLPVNDREAGDIHHDAVTSAVIWRAIVIVQNRLPVSLVRRCENPEGPRRF